MIRISKILLSLTLLIIFSLFAFQEIEAACLSVLLKGNYTLDTGEYDSCTFSGTVNGVEEGNLTIPEGKTLTINGGQTVVWNPGYSVIIYGSIYIDKSAGGGQLRKAHIWVKDADDDGYPPPAMVIAQIDPPEGYKSRSATSFTDNFTYVADFTYDHNDNSALVYPGTVCEFGFSSSSDNFGDESKIASKTNLYVNTSLGQVRLSEDCSIYTCGESDGAGGCKAKTAGEYDLPTCQRCDGTSLNVVILTDYEEDASGSNTCVTSCYGCLDGACEIIPNNVQDTKGSGRCDTTTGTCKACQGNGSCGNLDAGLDPDGECGLWTCTDYTYGWGSVYTSRCYKYSSSLADKNGYCNGSGACYTITDSCTGQGAELARCGSSQCKKACVTGAASTLYDTVAEACYTTLQRTCDDCFYCNSSGTCTYNVNSAWGAGSYGCTAWSERCVSSSIGCRSCGTGGGVMTTWEAEYECDWCDNYDTHAGDENTYNAAGQGSICWRTGAAGLTCDQVCASYGTCVDEDWDDYSWNACKAFYPGATSWASGIFMNYIPGYRSSETKCIQNADGVFTACSSANGDMNRLCICKY